MNVNLTAVAEEFQGSGIALVVLGFSENRLIHEARERSLASQDSKLFTNQLIGNLALSGILNCLPVGMSRNGSVRLFT